MILMKTLIILIGCIIQTLTFSRILKTKWRRREHCGWIIACMSVAIVINAFMCAKSSGVFTGFVFMTAILISVLTSNLYIMKASTCCLVVVLNMVVSSLCELFAGVMTSLIFGKMVSQMMDSLVFFGAGLALTVYLYYCIVSFLIILLHKSSKKLSMPFIMSIIIVPISFELICILLYRLMDESKDVRLNLIALVAVILLIVATVLIFYVIDKQTKLELQAQKMEFAQVQLEKQKEHYEELYRSQKDARKIYHDLKNSLIALNAMIEDKDDLKAKEYIHGLTGKVDQWMEIINTGVPAIDGILRNKINIARQRGCEIKYKLLLPEKLLVDDIELAVLIGNLLDNAVEASEKLESKEQRTIYFRITTRFDYISMEVRNNVASMVDVTKLNTTKEDRNNHGFGLENAREIVRRYDGDLDMKCDGETFVTQVMITNIRRN